MVMVPLRIIVRIAVFWWPGVMAPLSIVMVKDPYHVGPLVGQDAPGQTWGAIHGIWINPTDHPLQGHGPFGRSMVIPQESPPFLVFLGA